MKIQNDRYGPWVDDLLQAIPYEVYPPAARAHDIKDGVIFSINDRAAVAVLSLEWGGDHLWCKALAGNVGGPRKLAELLQILERMAAVCRAHTVNIQTRRKGMARVLIKNGYMGVTSVKFSDVRYFAKSIKGAV